MLLPTGHLKVYLALGRTDMRKSINGLSMLVEDHLELDPFSGHLFVFCNRRHHILKILYWDKNGFCLWQKRLERARFKWPRKVESDVITLTGQQLNWLLDGYDVMRLQPHERSHFHSVL